MFKMPFIRKTALMVIVLIVSIQCTPALGGSYHHFHHRIHVPQKIKTIYHTKIIKVPEHHHHFHEKEKIIIEKEKPKEEHQEFLLDDEEDSDWTGLESSHLFKKKRNALHSINSSVASKYKKKRIVRRHPYNIRRP